MQKVEQKKAFGAAVKSERIRLGFSQETLAERANLHRTYITDVERGARNLSLETIYKISDALHVSVSSLFTHAEARKQTDSPTGKLMKVALPDVLLVESDEREAELALASFRQACLTNHVHVARDGEAALDYLFDRHNKSPKLNGDHPHLVLLNLHVPKVHGLEVLRRIKHDEGTRDYRVVVVAHSRQDEDLRKAMDLGAQASLVKPVDFANFSKIACKLGFNWALHGSHNGG